LVLAWALGEILTTPHCICNFLVNVAHGLGLGRFFGNVKKKRKQDIRSGNWMPKVPIGEVYWKQ
jgi:hypothetical protein